MISHQASSGLPTWDIGSVARRTCLVIVVLILGAAAYSASVHGARPGEEKTASVAATVVLHKVAADGSRTSPAPAALLPSSARRTNIYYSCPACLGEHPLTMMQTDSRAGFEAMSFKNNHEQCPTTGLQVVLSKSQLVWKDEPGVTR